jgi:hypothetical protein
MLGVAREARGFVACLPCSDLIYAEATRTQGHEDWLAAHVGAFAYIGRLLVLFRSPPRPVDFRPRKAVRATKAKRRISLRVRRPSKIRADVYHLRNAGENASLVQRNGGRQNGWPRSR